MSRGAGLAVVSHYNIQRVVDIFGSVQDRDLGGVGSDITRIVDANRKNLPRGMTVASGGSIETMHSSFTGLLRRAGSGHRAGVRADRGEFSILAGSVHHYYRAAGGAGGNRTVSVRDAHDHQRAGA